MFALERSIFDSDRLFCEEHYVNLVMTISNEGIAPMNQKPNFARSGLFCALLTAMVSTVAAQDAPSWLRESERLSQQAQSAMQAGESAGSATESIIKLGTAPGSVMQAVVTAYGSCDSLEQSVTAALAANPQSAYDVVAASTDLPSCPCSADNVWPHTRIESRLRVPTRRFESVGMGVASNCVAIAASAAAKQAPEQAKAILAAVIGDPSGRPGSDPDGRQVVDTIGKSGESRDGWQGESSGKPFALTRSESNCEADRDATDGFGVIAGWNAKGESSADDLGNAAERCASKSSDLVISSYQTDGVEVNTVELLNNTAVDIDLKRSGYVLEIYAKGSAMPAQTVALDSILPSGSAIVLAGKNAPDATRAKAQLVLADLQISDVNAVVLRRGASTVSDCSRAPMALGMVATALGNVGEQWLDDTAKDYESQADVRQIDAIGSVGAKSDTWLGAKAGQAVTVVRQESQCEGDGNSADDFNGAPGWAVSDGVAASSMGSMEGRCVNAARDLVISEYQNDAEKYRSVAVLNNTGAQVDLGNAGYVLEVYAEGSASPTNTIPLKGVLGNGKSLVIADESAPADVKAKANVVTNELAASQINALVLKRISVSSARACQADIIAASKDIKLPVELAAASAFAPSREPRTDDALDNRPVGAEIASPN